MSNLFKGVRCLTQEQYEELKTNGTITIDSETYLFEEDWLYVTPEDVSGIARNNKKRLDSLSNDYEATKLVVAENKNNITLLKSNYTTISNDLNDVKTDVNNLIATSVTLDGVQTITGPKTFTENIYLANADGTVDRISHINNNFIIYSGAEQGVALLNIDEGLDKIYAFNKELAFKEDLTDSSGSKVYVSGELKESVSFDEDPQTQLNNKLNKLESSSNKELVNVNNEGQLEKTTFTANHLHGLKEQIIPKNVLDLSKFNGFTAPNFSGTPSSNTYDISTGTLNYYPGVQLDSPAGLPIHLNFNLKPNTTYTISGTTDKYASIEVYEGTWNNSLQATNQFYYFDDRGNFEGTFTTGNATDCCILVYGKDITTPGQEYQCSITNFQLEEGAEATEFEPYVEFEGIDNVAYQSDLAVKANQTDLDDTNSKLNTLEVAVGSNVTSISNLENAKVSKSGDTMTGTLIVNASGSTDNETTLSNVIYGDDLTIPDGYSNDYWILDEANITSEGAEFIIEGLKANAPTYFSGTFTSFGYGGVEYDAVFENALLPITVEINNDSSTPEKFEVLTPTKDNTIVIKDLSGRNNPYVSLRRTEGVMFRQETPLDINAGVIKVNKIINVEHVETIYDKTSSDSSKNWGYTSGIRGATRDGITVTGVDFTKYKKLIIYMERSSQGSWTNSFSFELDLTKPSKSNGGYSTIGMFSNGYIPFASTEAVATAISKTEVAVSADKTVMSVRDGEFDLYASTTWYWGRNKVYKIEGVY